jgi:hypothetical protein
MRITDSFRQTIGAPTPKVNMALLALSAFPLEITAALGGIALFLKSKRRSPCHLFLLVIVTITFLVFAVVFKGRLPHAAGPERIFLPYIVLLLPFAGFLLIRFIQTSVRDSVYGVFAGLLLLTIGSFDITRAFNYPTAKEVRDPFAAGWTLRMLQDTGTIRGDERILIEKAEISMPSAILILANKPERFVILDSTKENACSEGLQTQVCWNQVLDGRFDIIMLSSPEKVRSFQGILRCRSWQIGKYHIFEVNCSSQHTQVGLNE